MTFYLHNVSKQFKDGNSMITLFHGLTIRSKLTGLIAIHGQSGSGKTTLLHIIGGLVKPMSGTIEINGKQYSSLEEYRKLNIGFVFQNYVLVPSLTIKQNCLLGLYCKSKNLQVEKQLLKLCKELEIEHILDHYPSQVSGGQLQRAALVRAFLCDCPILLCDEPTGALHKQQGEVVMRFLELYARNHLVFIVSHDIDLVSRYTNQIVDLQSPINMYDFTDCHYAKINKSYKKQKNWKFRYTYLFQQLKSHKKMLKWFIGLQAIVISCSISLFSIGKNAQQFINQQGQTMVEYTMIDVRKNDYVNPAFTQEEIKQLQTKYDYKLRPSYNLSSGASSIDKDQFFLYSPIPQGISHIVLQGGTMPKKQNEVIVTKKLITEYKLKVGDTFDYELNDRKITCKIAGVIDNFYATTLTIYYNPILFDQNVLDQSINKTCYTMEVVDTQTRDKILTQIKDDTVLLSSYAKTTIESYQTLVSLGMFVLECFFLISFIISMILVGMVFSSLLLQWKKNYALLLAFGLKPSNIQIDGGLIGIGLSIMMSTIGTILSIVILGIVNLINRLFQFVSINKLASIINIDISLLLFLVYSIGCVSVCFITTRKIMKMDCSLLLKGDATC